MVANVHPMAGFLFGYSGECSSHQTAAFWGSLQLVHYVCKNLDTPTRGYLALPLFHL